MNSARKFKSLYRTLQYTFVNMMIHTFLNQFIIYVHMGTIYLANLQGIQACTVANRIIETNGL